MSQAFFEHVIGLTKAAWRNSCYILDKLLTIKAPDFFPGLDFEGRQDDRWEF